ncbi:unnamed protein product [Malassezia sympodialis ATCC 42132]|uniref:Similar to S.cerevisiae protein OCA6 (Cytoplasmic protein required for replication of Brome mosaic virus) n=1 Tax=Malassezia sympodialis (strain ATCC 42132) TaxID=1230383 RepID=M5EP33_MALS4|nr:uncharacterized protein MSY001_2185 [Malassezia sympodialis ATCC 42132]CCU99479.1 unnamed protein product [Malassezia sympodialis ATCC 42132]SHO78165.1 Similar to S.cerevisiae protein OCA6 (Cytoplasmic protein required for replication of Brome mosaic virus) [Malassezia sympodialis ATCC 42132]|eukprot:XP_018740724.1 uncharacterized protein MSY001_2185 [Malassezia sympodialis ATCC 42132]
MTRGPLSPPMRFGIVAFPQSMPDSSDSGSSMGTSSRITSFSECLYRGAYPKHRNLPFLETLHLRTIVSLTPKPIDSDPVVSTWARAQNGGAGVHIIHVRTEKPKEETGGLTHEGAARALMEVLNRENLPLYVHCLDGVEVTSTLVACLRKIQGWSSAALGEELTRGVNAAAGRYSGTIEAAPKHLVQFVERYGQTEDVLLPQRDRIPVWLWPSLHVPLSPHDNWNEKRPTVLHPTLRIQFERSESYIAAQQARFGAVWSLVSHSRSHTPTSLSISDSSDGQGGHPDSRAPSPSVHNVSRRYSDHDLVRIRTSRLRWESTDPGDPAVNYSRSPPTTTMDDQELRTPRARPSNMQGDVPPLSALDGQGTRAVRSLAESELMHTTDLPYDERTPLAMPYDAAQPEWRNRRIDDIPPLGLDAHAYLGSGLPRPWAPRVSESATPAPEADDSVDDIDDIDDEVDDEDDLDANGASLVLEALDLEGY